jgi:hypothetical protein
LNTSDNFESDEVSPLVPIVRQQSRTHCRRILHRFLAGDLKQDIVTAPGTTANKPRSLPPSGEPLAEADRIIQAFQLELDASDPRATTGPRTLLVRGLIDNLRLGPALKPEATVLGDSPFYLLAWHNDIRHLSRVAHSAPPLKG